MRNCVTKVMLCGSDEDGPGAIAVGEVVVGCIDMTMDISQCSLPRFHFSRIRCLCISPIVLYLTCFPTTLLTSSRYPLPRPELQWYTVHANNALIRPSVLKRTTQQFSAYIGSAETLHHALLKPTPFLNPPRWLAWIGVG